MTSKNVSQKKKSETPRDLRKKNKRLKEARDAFREKNKAKATDIKKLRGTIDDLKVSQDSWKTQYKQAIVENNKLVTNIKIQSQSLTKSERTVLEKDKQLLELQKKCEELKKR